MNCIYNLRFVNQSTNLQSPSENYGSIFRNVGNVPAFINEFPIYPGEVVNLMSDFMQDRTRWQIRFENLQTSTVLAPVTRLIVMTKEVAQ